MNVLFLTLVEFHSIEEHNIYSDLLRAFRNHGHEVYIISPVEKREGEETHIIEEPHSKILKLRIGNIQKTNIIEKGITTLSIETVYKKAIQKHFSDVRFDLVLYSTPPITFCNAIEFVKKRDNARTYLLLKDIFPQNSIDIGLLSKSGPKGAIYQHFRKQEKKLYEISDMIGCMSPANVRYVLEHNSEILKEKVEVCPNSVEPIDRSCTSEERNAIRKKYNLPLDKKIFVYGGNLGKPQGVGFLIECLQKQKLTDAYFLIVGSGTEYGKLKQFVDTEKPENVMLLQSLPREDYDKMIGACDVGMIFLDYRFTIPNFPSRLLSYMQAKLPVLCATDPNTDIGTIAEGNGFGYKCLSNDAGRFVATAERMLTDDLTVMGQKAYDYMLEHYTVEETCNIIISYRMLNNE